MLVSRIPSSGNTLFVNRESNSLQTVECKACNQEGGKEKMKKFLVFLCAIGLVFGLMGVQQAESVVVVSVDIEPGTCPNTLNIKGRGLLPVAVLGTDPFDVTTIDRASIRLQGVAPIRSNVEDVATPFNGVLCDCHDLDGDEDADLILKFDIQELVTELGLVDLEDGYPLTLYLTGKTVGGAPLEGEDCVVIRNKKWDGLANPTVEIIVDDPEALFEPDAAWGYWTDAQAQYQAYDAGLRAKVRGDGTSTATWTPDLPRTGTYKVYAWWWDYNEKWRSHDVPYTIYSGGVELERVEVDQTDSGPGGGKWNLLGSYTFSAGTSAHVVLSDDCTPTAVPGGTAYPVGDAIKFELQ